MGAVITALVFIVTWSLRIPIPATSGGYINLGDIVIYLAALAVGGVEEILGAAIGSALSDLLGGAAVYIIPTFVIKGLMAAAALVIIRSKKTAVRYILACLTGGAIMTAGYGVYEYILFGFAYAAASLPMNIMQWLCGVLSLPPCIRPPVKFLQY